MSSFVRLSLGAAFAVAIVACSSTNTTTTTDAGPDTSTGVKDAAVPDTSDSAVACTLTAPVSSDPTCNGCAQTNCCEEANACDADTKCTDINECLNNCSDGKFPDASTFDAADQTDGGPNDTCIQACLSAADKTGFAELKAVVNCVFVTGCKTECGG